MRIVRAMLALIVMQSTYGFAQEVYKVVIAPETTDMNSITVVIKEVSEQPYTFSTPAIGNVRAGETYDLSWKYGRIGPVARYGFFGTYPGGGVTVSVDSEIATSLVGRPWESIFIDPAFSEAVVNTALATFSDLDPDNNDYDFPNRLATYMATFQVSVHGIDREIFPLIGSPSTLLNFSDAYPNGSVRFVQVPEPSTNVMFVAVVVGLLGSLAGSTRRI